MADDMAFDPMGSFTGGSASEPELPPVAVRPLEEDRQTRNADTPSSYAADILGTTAHEVEQEVECLLAVLDELDGNQGLEPPAS